MKYIYVYLFLAIGLCSCRSENQSSESGDIIAMRSSTQVSHDDLDPADMPASLASSKYFRIYDKKNNLLDKEYLQSNDAIKSADDVVVNNRFQGLVSQYFYTDNPKRLFDMLNYGLIINRDGKYEYNEDACGNAWFIDNLVSVAQANAESAGAGFIDPAVEALVLGSEFGGVVDKMIPGDRQGSITLVSRTSGERTYSAETSSAQLAVISELWDPQRWKVSVNGDEVPVIRVNGLLYALMVPSGKSTIVFSEK